RRPDGPLGAEDQMRRRADEALVVLKGRQDVDILFTDVNMAGSMDGLQLANRVRAIRPNIGIIITSGMVRLDPMSE
ncbi:response regulator, partial [Rhizobium leguminosarum]|uniref:response regulator n=1 Tax=Rhizobium leguminosarum TaxID=384 RepID=UPI003F9C26F9